MIKLPSDEFIIELKDNYAKQTCYTIDVLLNDYNAEILRLNTPERPIFEDWVNYFTKESDGVWFKWENKPEYKNKREEWQPKATSEFDSVLSLDQILWLEHVNAGKSPENSLVKLEEYL